MSGHNFKGVLRFTALFLSLTLILSNPVFALRQTGLEEQTDEKGNPVPGTPKAELVAALAGSEEGNKPSRLGQFARGAALVAAGVVAGAAGKTAYDQWTAPSVQPVQLVTRTQEVVIVGQAEFTPKRLSVQLAPQFAGKWVVPYLRGADLTHVRGREAGMFFAQSAEAVQIPPDGQVQFTFIRDVPAGLRGEVLTSWMDAAAHLAIYEKKPSGSEFEGTKLFPAWPGNLSVKGWNPPVDVILIASQNGRVRIVEGAQNAGMEEGEWFLNVLRLYPGGALQEHVDAIRQLGEMGPSAPEQAPAIMDELIAKHWKKQGLAYNDLGTYDPQKEPYSLPVLEALRRIATPEAFQMIYEHYIANDYYTPEAVAALASMGPEAESSLIHVLELRHDPESGFQGDGYEEAIPVAIEALGRIGSPGAVAALQAIVRGEGPYGYPGVEFEGTTGLGIGAENIQHFKELARIALDRSQQAGMKGIQSVFSQLLEKDSAMRQTLEGRGWVSLQSGQVGAFGYQAIGGFIVADSAKLTDASHAVIADEDLSNELAERALAWIKAGKAAPDVVKNARLMNARRGDLLVFEEEPGLTAEQIEQLLAENGIEGAAAARAVMGNRLQVRALPVSAFQLFASEDGLPPVIVLSVAVRLQDEQGNTYTLVLMA